MVLTLHPAVKTLFFFSSLNTSWSNIRETWLIPENQKYLCIYVLSWQKESQPFFFCILMWNNNYCIRRTPVRYINLHTFAWIWNVDSLSCRTHRREQVIQHNQPQEELLFHSTCHFSASLHDDDDTHSVKACSYPAVIYQLWFKGHFSFEDASTQQAVLSLKLCICWHLLVKHWFNWFS